jgi:tetratricopeptide (TPR) repeat protein
MALTNCKECNQEVSTEAKTCPYCGIDYPGVIENNHFLAGFIVLGLITILGIYVYTKYENLDHQGTEKVDNNVMIETEVAKEVQSTLPTHSSPEQPKPLDITAKEVTHPTQHLLIPTTLPAPVTQETPKQKTLEIPTISPADTPQIMVMRLLEYALNNGGLSHESEIQQTKLQIESTPKPAKGNKKAAKAINTKGIEAAKKGDYSNAVKMFEEANKLDKSDIEIVNNLGFSNLKQGNLDSAQNIIIIALTLSPDRAAAWENLGEVFGVKGDISKAVACFSNAYRFSKDRLKMHQYMKKLNEKERVKNLKQARDKAIKWAEKSYLKI